MNRAGRHDDLYEAELRVEVDGIRLRVDYNT